ncbi:transketolase [Nanoarchaeota archaeon]
MKIEELRRKANELRKITLNMCVGAGTGHVTSSFSCVEILTSLYLGGILRYNSNNPLWEDRDRFILSKGQASPILYTTLAEAGFFPKEWLDTFCKENAHFGVHLQCDIPGVEFTTGSLGHGLGLGCGMALAAKQNRKDHFVFVVLGDAELYEGSNWEAAMFASHNRLNNLIAIVDRNWLGVIDYTERALELEPLEDKWKSFGWEVKRINGNSIKEIIDALYDFRSYKRNKPYVIIADTVKGCGSTCLQHIPLLHGAAPKEEVAEEIKEELNKVCFYDG